SAKAEWKRLVHQLHDMNVLCTLDRSTLAGYCQAYGRWVEAERKLQETPAILKMPSGYLQQNPWLTIANKQRELMHRYATQRGQVEAMAGFGIPEADIAKVSPHRRIVARLDH